jgi:hypothetical protein
MRSWLPIVISLFICALNCHGQAIFKSCNKIPFSLSEGSPWPADSLMFKTYKRNCYASTTYLALYSDSTFRYKIDREGISGYASGTWSVIKNRIIILQAKKPARKLISVHGRNFSSTYELMDLSNMRFVQKKQRLYLRSINRNGL